MKSLMADAWHTFENLEKTSGNGVRAEVLTGKDSPWFSGHFRNDPILPGIAQLAMVSEAVSRMLGSDVRADGFKRVRFRQIVRPDDRLRIEATPVKAGKYSFNITVGEDVVCSGILITRQAPPLPNPERDIEQD